MGFSGMSENRNEPGIKFRDIQLLSSEFEVLRPVESEELKYNLELTQLEKSSKAVDGGSEMFYTVGFDLMHDVQNPHCNLNCVFTARYFRGDDASMSWEKFTDANAISHVVAYVREFVMNLTSRSSLPRLYLNPLNTNSLVKRFRDSQAEVEE